MRARLQGVVGRVFVDDGEPDPAPGTFEVSEHGDRLRFCCPCSCDAFVELPITFGPNEGLGWRWDGNREAPTLSPSILNSPCGWRGYLKAGAWESC